MTSIFEVEVIGEGHEYTLREICQRINLDEEFVVQCVDYGITEVTTGRAAEWRFSPGAIRRLQRAWRLQRDLEINFTGLGVVLDLLDDIEDMRHQIAVLEKRLKHWEP